MLGNEAHIDPTTLGFMWCLIGGNSFAKPLFVDFVVSAVGSDIAQAGIHFALQFGIAFFHHKCHFLYVRARIVFV